MTPDQPSVPRIHLRETRKQFFEAVKHLTTLSTATLVFMATVGGKAFTTRGQEWAATLLATAAAAIFASLFYSLKSMFGLSALPADGSEIVPNDQFKPEHVGRAFQTFVTGVFILFWGLASLAPE